MCFLVCKEEWIVLVWCFFVVVEMWEVCVFFVFGVLFFWGEWFYDFLDVVKWYFKVAEQGNFVV